MLRMFWYIFFTQSLKKLNLKHACSSKCTQTSLVQFSLTSRWGYRVPMRYKNWNNSMNVHELFTTWKKQTIYASRITRIDWLRVEISIFFFLFFCMYVGEEAPMLPPFLIARWDILIQNLLGFEFDVWLEIIYQKKNH